MQRKEKKQLPDLHVEVHALNVKSKNICLLIFLNLFESEPNN